MNTKTNTNEGTIKDTNTSNTPKVIKKMVGGKEKTFNFRDQAAPKHLKVTIEDENGQVLQTLIAVAKNFKTGSVGYYCGDKLTNPMNPDARYQVGMNFTLINSKPE